MRWIKVYCDEWLHGSTRWELTHIERAIWIDFLVLAGKNNPPGQVDFFSLEQLAYKIRIKITLLKSCILIFSKFKKIEVYNNSIIILNWQKYQSEYQRQKPYRNKDIKSINIKKLQDSYKPVTQKLPVEVEVEVEVDVDKEKNKYVSAEPEKNSGSSATEWKDCFWLKDYIERQTYLIDYKDRLLDYEWWDAVSVVINGVSPGFIEREFAKMGLWLNDNPSRKPTQKGIRRFVKGWLERAYEKERKFKT